MEFTEEAKAAIEGFIGKVLGRMGVSGEDRTEVGKELRSSYYEGAEARARERGDTKVTLADVTRAIAAEGTSEQIAACYMKSYAGHLRRAGILSRTIAYLVDALLIGAGIMVFALATVLFLMAIGIPVESSMSDTSYDIQMQYDTVTGWMVAVMILVMLAFFVTAFSYVICYTILLEGYYGRTVGKYLMGLKVLREDGTKIGYREAILRNIPKYLSNFIVFDALIMLVFFSKEKQRAFDKVAGTIVVHTRG